MAVHYQTSQADGWAGAGYIRAGGVASRAIRQMEKDVIPQLDGIIYVSRSAHDHLVSLAPDATEVRSAIVPNFVVPVEAPEPRSQVADLVSVGSLLKGKNHRYLLEILAAAKQGGERLTLDVYGDGPLRRQLVRLAHTLGVDQQVRFIGYQPGVRRCCRHTGLMSTPRCTRPRRLPSLKRSRPACPSSPQDAVGPRTTRRRHRRALLAHR